MQLGTIWSYKQIYTIKQSPSPTIVLHPNSKFCFTKFFNFILLNRAAGELLLTRPRWSILPQRSEIADICGTLSGHLDYSNGNVKCKKRKRRARKQNKTAGWIVLAPLRTQRAVRAPNVLPLRRASKDDAESVLSVFPLSVERWRRRRRDKQWETAARDNLGRGGGKRPEKCQVRLLSPSVRLFSEPPFFFSSSSLFFFLPRVCQGRPEWMPIIPPNNVPQQYFNDAPFVEKPLSSQELIGF